MGTLFLPVADRLSSRKQWIAYGLRSTGQIVIDEGAKKAILSSGRSLLPTGIIQVDGSFERGDAVSCSDPHGFEFARGLVNYSFDELDRIKGRRSCDIEGVLGYKYTDEIIHRDDLVIL